MKDPEKRSAKCVYISNRIRGIVKKHGFSTDHSFSKALEYIVAEWEKFRNDKKKA